MIKKFFNLLIFFTLVFYVNFINSKEVLIYADNISYDKEKNLIARGNAKIINENEIIQSDLIIYKKSTEKYLLPLEFSFKDKKNNFFYGTDGEFSSNLKKAKINNAKILLNDGSRIVGKSVLRDGDIDIISKGSYSPCSSRINIKNYICPIWQIDGEKILHDNKNLFLYQKHSKMRLFNVPVFFLPYMVTPSPLRKERKSGFLNPSLSFNFIDTNTPQSLSLPYYFNLDIDKELTFTPIIKYGGGIDSEQRLLFDYNQLISGGTFSVDVSADTLFNRQNTEEWFSDASLITNYKNNLNETFFLDIESALQTSQTYLRSSDPNNLNSSKTSLSSSANLSGYGIINPSDYLLVNTTTYQVVQSNEDNRTTPTSFPYVIYRDGIKNYKNINYENNYQFYNIFREISTTDHAQKQIKLGHFNSFYSEFFYAKSKIDLKSEIHNQIYQTENKKIGDNDFNNNSYRVFPMTGLFIETPLKNIKNNILITPKVALILNSGQSNSNKISNEDSTNNNFTINNLSQLNRYSGTDKLDNSKRFVYGLDIEKNAINISFAQQYELTDNSNYQNESGNNDYLSDGLGNISYNNEKNLLSYDIRYDFDQSNVKEQSLNFENNNKYGDIQLTYLDQKTESNSILSSGNEQLTFKYKSKKFNKYNKINLSTSYNLITDEANEYNIGYSYFDECFGISLDYKRTFYKQEDDLKPQDFLTLMFSFKNLGSYKSSNLAVSETDKQDIEWIGGDISEEEFY